jgi:hypothetical protein
MSLKRLVLPAEKRFLVGTLNQTLFRFAPPSELYCGGSRWRRALKLQGKVLLKVSRAVNIIPV